MRSLFYITLVFTFSLLFTFSLAAQSSFGVSGNWGYSVPSNVEAGDDFSSTYASGSAQVYLSATTTKGKGNAGNFRWNISVHKEDANWHSSLNLSVRRTGNGASQGNGNGGGLIQGGTSFQGLSGSSFSFFSGKKGRTDIPLQYQVSGVSILIPSGNYSTTVVFTMTEQ